MKKRPFIYGFFNQELKIRKFQISCCCKAVVSSTPSEVMRFEHEHEQVG